MLEKFKKQYTQICESMLGYTISTLEKEPISITIDGRSAKIQFKVSQLIDTNGEIKSLDPIFETVRLIADDGTEINGQDLLVKYNDYIKQCIEDSLKEEKLQSKKEAKKKITIKKDSEKAVPPVKTAKTE